MDHQSPEAISEFGDRWRDEATNVELSSGTGIPTFRRTYDPDIGDGHGLATTATGKWVLMDNHCPTMTRSSAIESIDRPDRRLRPPTEMAKKSTSVDSRCRSLQAESIRGRLPGSSPGPDRVSVSRSSRASSITTPTGPVRMDWATPTSIADSVMPSTWQSTGT